MGAYGALSLGIKFHGVFGAIAAMSPRATLAMQPSVLDQFFAVNTASAGTPTRVRTTEELRDLLSGNVTINLMFARAAAWSPNTDKPPYFVDLL